MRGDVAEIRRILARGETNVNAAGMYGFTPLSLAVHYFHPDAARLLIEAGAIPSAEDLRGWLPQHLAAWKGGQGPRTGSEILAAVLSVRPLPDIGEGGKGQEKAGGR